MMHAHLSFTYTDLLESNSLRDRYFIHNLFTGFVQIFGSKFKTFSRILPKQNYYFFFPDAMLSNKNRSTLKNAGPKLFFRMPCKQIKLIMGEIE